jgi:hypothetical protein
VPDVGPVIAPRVELPPRDPEGQLVGRHALANLCNRATPQLRQLQEEAEAVVGPQFFFASSTASGPTEDARNPADTTCATT